MTDPAQVLSNARLVGGGPEPRDLLLERGVVRVITERRSSEVRGVARVDLDGRFVMRGMWDHHVHFDQWALARRRLDLTGCGSAAQCAELVRQRLVENPPPSGEPLVGHGFRDGVWPDEPSRAALDTAAGPTPVLLISHDLHCAWLNTAGFAYFGLRANDGGLVREAAFHALTPRLSQVPTRLLDEWVEEAARAAAQRGVTGVVDFEMADNVVSWTRRIAAGTRWLRIESALYPAHAADAIGRGLRTGDPVPGTQELLRVGPVKVLIDGSLNTRTAYCHAPYPEPSADGDPHGVLLVPPEELMTVLDEARRHGLHAAVHAIGDLANTLALDGFARSGASGSVEHAQLVCSEDLPRFAELGVTASVQPGHALQDRDVADRHWPGRTGRAFPYAGLLAHGAVLRFGSDAPVAPLDPWSTIAAAVHRSGDGRQPWHPEQEIPIEAALAASTRGRYTPRSGDRADLTVTDLDPLSATPAQLMAMPVSGTLLGGRWTWQAVGAA